MTDQHPIDFVGHPYPFRRAPVDDAPRSVDLLLDSFAAAGCEAAGRRLTDALVEQIGPGRTVWGVKSGAERPTWELYWYDDHPDRRELTYAQVAAAAAAGAALDAPATVNEALAYVSVSFELRQHGADLVATCPSLYFGESADSGRSVGLSYALIDTDLELRNTYQTFDATDPEELRRLTRFLQRSARCAGVAPTDTWLGAPGAATIILARKPLSDALYFRRIDLSAALALPGGELLPPALRSRLAAHDLGHLFVDCGLDYRHLGHTPVVERFCLFGYL